MQTTEDIFHSIINSISAYSPKWHVLLNKNPLATSLVEQYEVLHGDVSVRLSPNVNFLNKQQITNIIEKMLYYQYPIISMEEYYLMESFQGYFGTLGDIKKQDINALLPSTKKRHYQLEDFEACWSNKDFFYINFEKKSKVYFQDTMQEIILPKYLHLKVLDQMLFSNRKNFTEKTFTLMNRYFLDLYQHGIKGYNCKIEYT